MLKVLTPLTQQLQRAVDHANIPGHSRFTPGGQGPGCEKEKGKFGGKSAAVRLDDCSNLPGALQEASLTIRGSSDRLSLRDAYRSCSTIVTSTRTCL